MTSNEISAVAGVALSLILSYVPGLREWFAAKDSITKTLILGVLLILVAAGSLLYKCNLGVECITTNWREYAYALFLALVASQSIYSMSPQPTSVKEAKASRPQEQKPEVAKEPQAA